MDYVDVIKITDTRELMSRNIRGQNEKCKRMNAEDFHHKWEEEDGKGER